MAKIDGEMSSDEKRSVLHEFESTFRLTPRIAAELLGSSAYLLGDPKILLSQLDPILANTLDRFTSEQVISTLAMLERIARSAGEPSETQRELIDAIRSRLSRMQPSARTWN